LTAIDPNVLAHLAAAVLRCGIPSSDVEISYEDYLQSEEIRVRTSTLTDSQINCLDTLRRAPPFPIVTFTADIAAIRDAEITASRYREESREWLRQRGLLDRLPNFDPAKEAHLQFARRLEAFCGVRPGAAFEINEQFQFVTMRSDWVGKPLRKGWLWRKIYGPRHDRQFECLMRAMSATNAEEHGLHFGFVGNEAYIDTSTK